MMKSFFNEEGYLNIDEAFMGVSSFKKIMEDGVVSDEEVIEQSKKVTDLFRKLEQICNQDQIDLIGNAITELGVLFTVYNYKEIQSLK